LKIELKKITIDELVKGYEDNQDGGVVGYGGELDIRPPFQREFIYEDDERAAVIDTVRKGFPLNVMYWAVRDQGGFEIIDGQQRTISICQYIEEDFSVKGMFFNNLQKDEQEQILNYELMVYFCSGTPSEKLAWFKTINIAGKTLSDQEMRNAVYAGSWVTDAKRYFSKKGGPADDMGGRYLTGAANRQEYLETAIKWFSGASSEPAIREYMGKHQHKPDAEELWLYFRAVIDWTETLFPTYRKQMKGLEWGGFYNKYKDKNFDPAELEMEVSRLMKDPDVTSRRGIYSYIFTGDESHLNIRFFDDDQKSEVYEIQNGICPHCNERFELKEMEAHHIKPWRKGGATITENCKMLCRPCHYKEAGK